MSLIKYIGTLALALCMNSAIGQWTGAAYEFYKNQDFVNAQEAIDSAINTNERFDSQTWELRGLIYRSISTGDQLYSREIAMESFTRAKKIDSTGVYTAKINDYLKNTILRYYNDAVTQLTVDHDFDKAIISYETYKKYYKSNLDPSFDFKKSDVDFYIAMGAEYLAKSETVELNKKSYFREKSIEYSKMSLNLDSTKFQSNFNIGIVYYTIGVEFITTVDPEITIEELILNQKRAEEAFLKALPYFKRTELIQPENMEVKIGFMGCYYALNNQIEYLKYQTYVDLYYLSSYLEEFEKNPKNLENVRNLYRIYTETLPNEVEASKFRDILNSSEDE